MSVTVEPIQAAPSGQDSVALFCPECGYSLQGIGSARRCPECGTPIDRAAFALSQIPWVHRRRLGRVRTYWRTVILATFRPARLAGEASKPVSYADARWYLLVTAAVASAPVIAALVGFMLWHGGTRFLSVVQPSLFGGMVRPAAAPSMDVLVPWEAGATWAPVLPLVVPVAALLIAGVGTYWFHPRSLSVVRQNRAVALAHYACAPLAFSFVPTAAAVMMAVMRWKGFGEPGARGWAVLRVVQIFLSLSLFTLFAAFGRTTLSLLSRTTHPSFGRLTLAGILLPTEWLLCAAGAGFALPWVVGFLRLVVSSLR